MDTTAKMQNRMWSKNQFIISTDSSFIPITTLNSWFASDGMYWAKAMPDDIVRETLRNSLCFGLFEDARINVNGQSLDCPPSKFIGIARCITDFTTFIYLTDVYIDPAYQGSGLGRWLLACISEVIESMPHLRRSLLFTGDWKRSVPFYEKQLGMSVMECKRGEDGKSGEGVAVMQRMFAGFPGFESQ